MPKIQFTTPGARPAGLAMKLLAITTAPLLLVGCAGEDDTAAQDRPTITQTITKAGPRPSEGADAGDSNGPGEQEGAEPSTQARASKKPEPKTSPKSKPTKGQCPYAEAGPNTRPGEIISMYCDGSWMHAGRMQTDHVWVERFDGAKWVEVDPDGISHSGMYRPCFSEPRLRSLGAPKAILDEVSIC